MKTSISTKCLYMFLCACLIATLAVGAQPVTTAQAAPINDNFANGWVISGISGTVAGHTNVGATKEAGEPNHGGSAGGHSVWYNWTAPATGSVTFDTFGSALDTLLGVYTGGSVNALTTIASNDQCGSNASCVTFNMISGTTYHIAVDGWAGLTGTFNLNWAVAPPANDNFANAQVISGASGTLVGVTNIAATKESGEPNHGGSAGGHSVWYRWTAPAGGSVTFNTLGSSLDTLLGIYTGNSVNALTLIGGNDQCPSQGNTSCVTFNAVSGTIYRIAVDGWSGATGTFNLNWTATLDSTPPNTTIDSKNPSTTPTFLTTMDFTFSGTDNLTPTPSLTFQCRLDGAAFTTCTSPKNYSGLAPGSHTFNVRAIDLASNVDASPATYTWTIDTSAPDTSIDAKPTDPSTNTTAIFTFSSPDGAATFECNLDSIGWVDCTSPKAYNSLGLGSHTFQVRAINAAATADPTPATYNWIVKAPFDRVKNGSFETYTGPSKVPMGWAKAAWSAADGKDITTKKQGLASVRITGAPGKTKTLTQTIRLVGLTGDKFVFTFWAKGQSIFASGGLCQAQLIIYNGTTPQLTKTIPCKTGTYTAFQKKTATIIAPSDYTKVVIKFTYSKAIGKVWFDLVSLVR